MRIKTACAVRLCNVARAGFTAGRTLGALTIAVIGESASGTLSSQHALARCRMEIAILSALLAVIHGSAITKEAARSAGQTRRVVWIRICGIRALVGANTQTIDKILIVICRTLGTVAGQGVSRALGAAKGTRLAEITEQVRESAVGTISSGIAKVGSQVPKIVGIALGAVMSRSVTCCTLQWK